MRAGGIDKKLSRAALRQQILAELLTRKELMSAGCTLKINEEAGENHGFVLTKKNGEVFFIKTFDKELTENAKGIDPREAVLYKIFEHLEFGPQAGFALNGSQGYKHSYIITRSLSTVAPSEKAVAYQKFFLDEDIEEESFFAHKRAFASKDFLVQLAVLSALGHIFLTCDDIGVNYANYGIVEVVRNDGAIEYKPKIIDHLPDLEDVERRKSSHLRDLSPGRRLAKDVLFASGNEEIFSNLKVHILNSMEFDGEKKVNFEKFSTESLGLKENIIKYFSSTDINSVITRAAVEIQGLIESDLHSPEPKKIFMDNAAEKLSAYIELVRSNLESFKKGNYLNELDERPSAEVGQPVHQGHQMAAAGIPDKQI